MFEIGNSLREARVRRSVNLVEVEQDTKIRSKYIAALEAEDFDVLPGSVYTRGFLRTYAGYLGLDSQLYIDEYNARFGRFEEIDDPHISVATHDAGPGGPGMRSVAIVGLVLLAALAWLGLRAEPRLDLERPQALDIAADAATASRAHANRERARLAAARAAVPTVARLVVRTRGSSSWIEVRRGTATGQVLFAGVLDAHQGRTFTGPRLYVNLGYPAAVVLRVRQRTVTSSETSSRAFLVTPTRIRPVE